MIGFELQHSSKNAGEICNERLYSLSPTMSENIHTLGEGGGRSLGGDGTPEPLPAAWANRNSQPRVGRIGGPSTPAYVCHSVCLGEARN
jgi:hypothetical protein